jgi:hypothetical protein
MLKVIDLDGNGYGDFPEDQLRSWPITITDPLGTSNTFWSATVKECTFAQLVPGLYTVTEAPTDGNGNYVVTWDNSWSSSAPSGIFGQAFDASGDALTEVFEASTASAWLSSVTGAALWTNRRRGTARKART